MMRRTIGLFVTLALGCLVVPLAGEASPRGQLARIGVLCPITCTDPQLEVFRQALSELGYVEGQTIALEWRGAEQRLERLHDLARELVRLPVDVILALGHSAIGAAQRATTIIPIVMTAVDDPVQAGFVKSLPHPGGNITGLNAIAVELVGKQVELLKEAVPGVTQIAALGPRGVLARHRLELQRAARAFGIHVHAVDVSTAEVYGLPVEIERAFEAATQKGAGALIVLPFVLFMAHEQWIAELAAQHRLPAIFWHKTFAEVGGLMSYGASDRDILQRAAYYVDRILKGTKPADLPVEHPTRFELVINLKTAQALGLTIPPSLLFQATKVIR
jgi:putative tryptophan/tyrosine transport system substrate-binding protein